jgi:hypothetical protein
VIYWENQIAMDQTFILKAPVAFFKISPKEGCRCKCKHLTYIMAARHFFRATATWASYAAPELTDPSTLGRLLVPDYTKKQTNKQKKPPKIQTTKTSHEGAKGSKDGMVSETQMDPAVCTDLFSSPHTP